MIQNNQTENTTQASSEEVKTYVYDQRAIQSLISMLNQLIDTNGLAKCEIALNMNKLLSSPIKEDTYTHTQEKQ